MPIEPSKPWSGEHRADLAKVRALCERLGQPAWMPDPRNWVWRTSAGRLQGPGLIYGYEQGPALANLLWLALDFDHPPKVFDMSSNPLVCLVFGHAYAARLGGNALLDLAALHPLEQFAALLPETSSGNPLEQAYPVLRLLARRRLHHA